MNLRAKWFFTVVIVLALSVVLSAQLVKLRLPDLVVSDIRLVKNCQIQVTVKNIGRAGVPSSYYNLPKAVGVQMYRNGKPWGGLILKGFDPAGKLKRPGGEATYIWFPQAENLKLGPGPHSIKVIVDHSNVLKELKENNNTLTRRLICRSGSLGTPPPGSLKNKIGRVKFSPASPASLNFKDQVKVKFHYSVNQDAYIFARPMTKGQLTPNYAASGSPVYNKGKGVGEGNFTITKGKMVTVDAVRFRIMNKTQSRVLFEKKVRVKYTFPKLRLATPVVTAPPVATVTPGTVSPAPTYPGTVILDFKDSYLHFTKSSKSIQIAAERSVLSYGGDWEKCQPGRNIYHIRQNFWKNGGFYWEINLETKKVYEVRNGSFCKGGGKKKTLAHTIDDRGSYFMIKFKDCRLVYKPATKTVQIITGDKVLSYGQDWEKCNMAGKNYLFELRQNMWKNGGFYWKINSSRKQAWKVTGASFCALGGSQTSLNATVRAF